MSCFVQQIIVEDRHGCHSFNDRYGTWQDTWIVAAAGVEDGWIAILVDGLDLFEKRCNRLEGAAEVDRLTVGDAALDAAAVIATGSKQGVRS